MENKSFFQDTVNVAVSVAVLFGVIWVASRAWKSGQK